jgi:hypothetical protein
MEVAGEVERVDDRAKASIWERVNWKVDDPSSLLARMKASALMIDIDGGFVTGGGSGGVAAT